LLTLSEEVASMVSSDSTGESTTRTSAQFATTHWSVLLAAADSAFPNAQEALEKLCRTYWYPLYAFVRMKGHSPEDAKDLTQAFFERFLQKHYVKDVIREKGRFRTFLLILLQRFLYDQFDRSTAAKRGGGVAVIPLDTVGVEAQLDQAVATFQSPESMFERAWADTVVQTCLERLRAQYEAEGKGDLFGELRLYLSRPADRSAYSGTALRLGMSADAVAVAVMRLRRRYRTMVRAEVANTVATPAEIDDEMRYLVGLLTG
jgi:DNA-directed RNA polymerase specialized sigma24 family protein